MTAGKDAEGLLRLFPEMPGGERIAPREAYAAIDFVSPAPEERPYLVVNMVATADGQGRIGETTSDLGDAADAALFATLRERVDCVMAGTATVAAERYNAPARTPEVQQRRSAAGLQPRPLFAMVTRSGRLPLEAPLFADAGLRVAVFSEREPDLGDAAAMVEHVPTTEPAEVARSLRHDFGVRALLLEGGPHLNTPFFAAGLVDELFLTLAPVLTGGADAFPIIAEALPRARQLQLLGVLAGSDHLFLRYRVG